MRHVHDVTGLEPAWTSIATCPSCGLALLDLLFTANRWIARRTEGVSFLDDRTVRRRVTVDLAIPADAPLIGTDGEDLLRILPIAGMRRRNLVNFYLRDGADHGLPLLGLRQTQAFTYAMLVSWATTVLQRERHDDLSPDVRGLLAQIVSGNHKEYAEAWKLWTQFRQSDQTGTGSQLATLAQAEPRDLFAVVFERLARQFILFVPLHAEQRGRVIIKYAYDEPLTLRYRHSGYTANPEAGPQYDEFSGELAPLHPRRFAAALGWTPTLIRFPVPSAESSASFHLEISAPPDVAISEASILAGRPNVKAPAPCVKDGRGLTHPFGGVSFDQVSGGHPNVDLHVVDVPYGSLCRAQVRLTVPLNGWLASTFSMMIASSFLVGGITWWRNSYSGRHAGDTTHQAVGTVAATFAVALIALYAQPLGHKMAAKLLSAVRGLAIATALVALSTAMIVGLDLPVERYVLWSLTVVSWLLTLALIGSLRASYKGSRELRTIQSPWEQVPERPVHIVEPERKPGETWFESWQARYDFDKPAIRVASAEGSRRTFPWSDDFTKEFARRLEAAVLRRQSRGETNGQLPRGAETTNGTRHPKAVRRSGQSIERALRFLLQYVP